MTNKYHARKVRQDGYLFDSLAEAARYNELNLLQRAGEIDLLEVHPKFVLIDGFECWGEKIRPITYVADFQYWDNHKGRMVVEDVKGLDRRTGKPRITADGKIKIKLFKWKFRNEFEFRLEAR